ncbi:MAG: pyruvyl transferase [Alteromonadaceae bacterium]|nr:pyruvyl transferase [Alteromonadaceae bacterium]|tara:strand:+ start:1803 stop:2642 length:840 start_codon:yes stop_codon:yes gene_type:complete
MAGYLKKFCERAEVKLKEITGVLPRGVHFFRKDYLIRNFGDELSPILVREVLRQHLSLKVRDLHARSDRKLFAIGSILHFAKTGDFVWGSGVNGKVANEAHTFTSLDVRAVRGPLTRDYLLSRGVNCPPIYGDPALLLPHFMPAKSLPRRSPKDYIVIPNYNDLPLFEGERNIVSPLSPLRRVLSEIVSSKLVIASSLHGVILAEAYGVPAVLLMPEGHGEHIFKYRDYYAGTGRLEFPVASSIAEALKAGRANIPEFDPEALLKAFPLDFYSGSSGEL